jgi:opacity protein-like surface antigen
MRRFGAVYAIFLLLAFLLNVVPSLTTSANAEPYIALQLGAAISNKESNIKGTGGLAGNTFGDFELKSSFMSGFKTGYFFFSHRWLGVEADVFNSTPDVKRQTVAFSGPGGPGTIQLFGTDERVTVLALNGLARYPGEQFQPYVGVGLGIFFFKTAKRACRSTLLPHKEFCVVRGI